MALRCFERIFPDPVLRLHRHVIVQDFLWRIDLSGRRRAADRLRIISRRGRGAPAILFVICKSVLENIMLRFRDEQIMCHIGFPVAQFRIKKEAE